MTRAKSREARVAPAPWITAVTTASLMLLSAAAGGAATPQAPAKTEAPSRKPAKAATAKSAKSAAVTAGSVAPPSKARSDSSMTLKGGQEGTEFRTLTVEGEDRVHVDIERPALTLALDPEKVPGLDQGTARDVLDRTVPDLLTPMVSLSSKDRTPYLARPWLRQFASGSVARFRPTFRGVERWKLMIANSRGETVASYEGKGEPPKEIAWDGRSKAGTPVRPGVTYSYVLEAYDKAGNKRNFVGEGFEISAYRIDDPVSPRLVLSGKDLSADASGRGYIAGATGSASAPGAAAPPVLLEAASWANQTLKLKDPIRVRAAARSRDQANALANRAAAVIQARMLGDPARVQIVAEVEPDAPADGTLTIGAAR